MKSEFLENSNIIYITDTHWYNWFVIFHFSLSLADLGLVGVMVVDKCVAYHYLKYNMVEPLWFRLSYPYFWHPIKGIFLCATILMVVAVSAERFRAICYPFSYRHVSKFDIIIGWNKYNNPIKRCSSYLHLVIRLFSSRHTNMQWLYLQPLSFWNYQDFFTSDWMMLVTTT